VRRTTERGSRVGWARATSVGVAALAALGAFGACSSASPGSTASSAGDPPCVTGLTPSCAATYAPPTYDTIFTNIFQSNCSVGTGTCHTSDFAAGGLVFADESTSYATLLGSNGSTALVVPNDPGCSTLMKRLTSTDPSYHMPRGSTSLSAGDLCTIVQWIDEGALQ
jgi:hypothetical protein